MSAQTVTIAADVYLRLVRRETAYEQAREILGASDTEGLVDAARRAREALGEAWLTGGASLAEGIARKTAFLEGLVDEDDEAGHCEECDGAGVVEHVPGAGSSACDPAAAEDVPCPGCRRAEHEAWEASHG